MTQIFISYRRADSHAITDRIQDRLVGVYGSENVFQDVEDIPPGANFKEFLEIQVGLCDVLLAIIGPGWLDVRDENGNRRLDNPSDFVRIEVESGLKRKGILVVPVLVQGATMPAERDLPPQLRDLHYRNAIRVRNNPDFERDIQNLIDSINNYVKGTSPKKPESAPQSSALPMIIGAVILVALIAAFVAFGLPALQRPPATATPNATGTAQAVAAGQTSTAIAAVPTLPPRLTPTEAATEEVSVTPSATPTETATIAPSATVLYPDGNELDLYYNGTGFYLRNSSTSRISSSLLRFRGMDADGNIQRYQFFGSTWAGFGAPSINPNACVNVELLSSEAYERPEACRSYAARTQESRTNTPVFWIERASVTQFAVYWDNEEIGRCQIVDQSCTVFLPS